MASTARDMEAVVRLEAARMIILPVVMVILSVVMMVVVMGDGEEEVTDATMEAVSLTAHLAVLLAVHLELLLAQELGPADGGIQTP